jgi:transposase
VALEQRQMDTLQLENDRCAGQGVSSRAKPRALRRRVWTVERRLPQRGMDCAVAGGRRPRAWAWMVSKGTGVLPRCGSGSAIQRAKGARTSVSGRVGQGVVRKVSKATHEVRRFATTTQGLLELADWVQTSACTHVAMEATGVYWKPVWHVLEGHAELVLANAAHIRNVPGRKSDVNDAVWIADLLAHGLVRSSLVPPMQIQQMRDLTRTRKQLGREIVQHTQRIQKVLEDANVKLSSVISEVLGVSGRRILAAVIAGELDPERLAQLGDERLRCSRSELVEALRGRVTEHHRFLLRQHLRMIEELERAVGEFDRRIEAALEPFRDDVERLTAIPGVSTTAAQVILAEIGVDMSRFATVGHLLSWAGLCPRLDESAGKRRSTRVRKGAPWLKTVLVQCAWAASRAKETYLRAQFLRLKARRGPKKAVVAVAASILTAAYFMLRDRAEYRDLGPDHFVRRDSARTAERLARRIRELGYEVHMQKAA